MIHTFPASCSLQDPVTAMWQSDGNAAGYGGNFLANSPVPRGGHPWRLDDNWGYGLETSMDWLGLLLDAIFRTWFSYWIESS